MITYTVFILSQRNPAGFYNIILLPLQQLPAQWDAYFMVSNDKIVCQQLCSFAVACPIADSSTFNIHNKVSSMPGMLLQFDCFIYHCCRLRDERGDMDRIMAMDKARDGSHNGKLHYFANILSCYLIKESSETMFLGDDQ